MQLELNQRQVPSNWAMLWKVFTKKTSSPELPPMSISIPDFRFEPRLLKKYNRYCGFNSATEIPLCYPFVATQTVQLRMLTDPRMPITPLGMIHVGVSFEQQQPLALDKTYRFELAVSDQSLGERGLEFELKGSFFDGDNEVASYRSQCFIKMEGPKANGRPTREKRVNREWQQLSDLTLDESQARGYAVLSGDYNPIHLHSLLSKPFGFKQPIAHGMYMVAKVLASSPEPLNRAAFQFKRPATLPIIGKVEHSEGALRFVNDKRKPLLECQCC